MSLIFPQLPPELLEEVISFIQDDVPTLQAVSLVCHAWMSASRRYIFRSIELSNRLKQGWIFLPFALGRHVKHIAIRRLEGGVPGWRIRMLSPFATELRSLELTDIFFNDFLDLTGIVYSFRGLHSLTLSRVRWVTNSFNAGQDKLHSVPLSLSRLRSYYVHRFVGWLLTQRPQHISAWHLGPIHHP